MQAPYEGLDFGFAWSPEFQVYELLLRNRNDSTLSFTLSAWTYTPRRRVLFTRRWSLPAASRDWPPGPSVANRDGATVCFTITELRTDRAS